MSGELLIVGAAGYFGSLLVEDLSRHSRASLLLAGRDARRLEPVAARARRSGGSVRAARVDLGDRRSVVAALEGVAAACCAAGPFQSLPRTLLEECVRRGVPYVDLSDDRAWVLAAREAARDAAAPVCAGWSAVPALSAALARLLAEGLERVESIEVQLAPGNRGPRSAATVASLLHSAGRELDITRDGRLGKEKGWSLPRDFPFPEPVGPRRGWLVDAPDHALFPALFGARTVLVRVGAELRALNAAMSAFAFMRSAGLPGPSRAWAALLRPAMAAAGLFGGDAGALGVELHGAGGKTARVRRAVVVGAQRGPSIAVLPASVMLERFSRGEHGRPELDRWIDADGLAAECRKRGFSLVMEEG